MDQHVPGSRAVLVDLDLAGGLGDKPARPLRIHHGVPLAVKGGYGKRDSLQVGHDVLCDLEVLAGQPDPRGTFGARKWAIQAALASE